MRLRWHFFSIHSLDVFANLSCRQHDKSAYIEGAWVRRCFPNQLQRNAFHSISLQTYPELIVQPRIKHIAHDFLSLPRPLLTIHLLGVTFLSPLSRRALTSFSVYSNITYPARLSYIRLQVSMIWHPCVGIFFGPACFVLLRGCSGVTHSCSSWNALVARILSPVCRLVFRRRELTHLLVRCRRCSRTFCVCSRTNGRF